MYYKLKNEGVEKDVKIKNLYFFLYPSALKGISPILGAKHHPEYLIFVDCSRAIRMATAPLR